MSADHTSSQHEFALAETHTVTITGAHLNGGRDARIKTACAECKRRKTKCDGTHPCYSCRWYKQPERCVYTFSRPALILSRKNFESVRQRLETATDVLSKLFPQPSIDALGVLSREELLERLGSTSEVTTSSQDSAQLSLQSDPKEQGGLVLDSLRHGVRNIDDSPSKRSEEDEVDGSGDQMVDETSEAGDDVNALSATSAQPSSYVGPSSTMQMFRTILRIAPEPLSHSSQSPTTSQRSGVPRSPGATHRMPPSPKMTDRVSTLIDAYFHWVHPSTPILDEDNFRKTASSGIRNDPQWLCLFNMVLALGSIGMTKTDAREHLTYYHAAKSHLDLEGLGNKCLETLQALILMAGWYNHYRNRPNLASALLGAAFRMAYALGLHKEQPNSTNFSEHQELRRMIWWNLVVFDAAEAVTLARTLDTKVFENEVLWPKEVSTSIVDSPSLTSTLVITIGFSQMMTEVQSRLMTATAVPFTESLSLDAHLVDWHESLPNYFHRLVGNEDPATWDASATKRFVQPFTTIKWRYLNLRLLLYRPSLMEAVLHRIPFRGLTSDQRLCIRKCLTLSGETIDSVKLRASQSPNQYIAWPSTWYLLQISMVPLLSLYVFRDDGADRHSQAGPSTQHGSFKYPGGVDQVRQIRDECHKQVQTTLRLMKEMEPWAVASEKMHDLISHLYKARDQHLRVWNNTEERPVLMLGSPDNNPAQQIDHIRSRAPEPSHPHLRNTIDSRSGPAPPTEYTVGTADENAANPSTQHQYIGGPYNNFMNSFEQNSRDWSMYNSFNWPNATLESLFDLPDEFQCISQDPFGGG